MKLKEKTLKIKCHHLCRSCIYHPAECGADPVFSIELDAKLMGADADMVVYCKGYVQAIMF